MRLDNEFYVQLYCCVFEICTGSTRERSLPLDPSLNEAEKVDAKLDRRDCFSL